MDASPIKRYVCFDMDECIGRFIMLMPLFEYYGSAIAPVLAEHFCKTWIFRPGFRKVVNVTAAMVLCNKISGAVIYSNNNSERTVSAICEILNIVAYNFNGTAPFLAGFHRSYPARTGICKNFEELCNCMKLAAIEPPKHPNHILYFDDTLAHSLTTETKYFKHVPAYSHDIDVIAIKTMFSAVDLYNFELVCGQIEQLAKVYKMNFMPPDYLREVAIINEIVGSIVIFSNSC